MENKGFPILLAAGYLAGTLILGGLWWGFTLQERENAGAFFQWDVERLADGLARGHDAGVLDPEALPDSVIGFGLYNPLGLPLALYGDVVGSFYPGEAWDGNPTLIRADDGVIEFYRGLEIRRGPAPRGLGMMLEGYMVLRLKDSVLSSREQAWVWAAWIGELILGGLGLGAFFFHLRIRHYRKAAADNHELAQYAQASRLLAHEIKNPLAAILLQASLLKRSNREEGAVIEEEALRISHLLDKMREFLRDPKGTPEVVDLWAFLQDILKKFPQETILEPRENPGLKIKMEKARLRSLVENLVKNAWESGSDPQVTVSVYHRRNRVVFQVADRGNGLAPEVLAKIFQPFFTTKTQGSGLGLVLAKTFAEGAGAHLTLENRPGGGAAATVTFKEALDENPRGG